MEHHTVVIVGAGISGCSAAKTLLEHGIDDLIILEATGLVGGRARTIKTKYGCFECGAQWIHGDTGNILYEKMSQLGLLDYRGEHLHDDEFVASMSFYRPGGELIERDTVVNGFNIYDVVSDRILDMWRPESCSIETFKQQHFNNICNKLGVSPEHQKIFEAITVFQDKASGHDEGIQPNDRSYLLKTDLYDDCGGKNYCFMQGTTSILTHLLLPTIKDKIVLNTEVQQVGWEDDSGVAVVTTSKGLISADHVIMTPSIGFLKKSHNGLFKPSLPQDKIDALNGLTLGKAEKFCFLFDAPFWKEECLKNPNFSGYGFVYLEEELGELEASMSVILGREASWWKDVISLTTCTTNPNILLMWLTGDSSVEANKCSDSVIKEVVFSILQYFTGIRVTEHCKLLRTSWSTEKYFLGSWTLVDMNYRPEYGEAMLRPLYQRDKPTVLFAGEAYHPTYMSALHGAYSTGETQALNIIDFYQTKQQ